MPLQDNKLNQSYLLSQRRNCLLIMAGALFCVLVIVAAIIGVVLALPDDGCLGDLKCLPITECEGHTNPDFVYGCGFHFKPRICCEMKTNKTESNVNETATVAPRLEKTKLIPDLCGISTPKDRISFGINATIGEFPWMAILGYTIPDKKVKFVQRLCGGTVINNRYILTAAHCTQNAFFKLSEVTVGVLDLTAEKDCESLPDEKTFCADPPITVAIEKVIVHPKFDMTTIKNDIALLRLERPLNFTDYVKPICLPFGLKIDEDYFNKKNFTISGWGRTTQSSVANSNVLQYARISAWRNDRCNDKVHRRVRPIEAEQVCATGLNQTEACHGDSGGPMAYDIRKGHEVQVTQIGIVSFKSYDTCGTEDSLTVFTRVDAYLNWILDNLEP